MNAKRLHLVNKLQEAAIEAAMKKIWQRERANGETELSFSEWLISGKNSVKAQAERRKNPPK